jgi:hypothetical protein
VSCAEGTVLVEWTKRRGTALIAETPGHAQALADVLPEPLGPLLAPPRAWDLEAPERAHVAGELAAWPFPGTWGARPAPAIRYAGRKNVEPPPMRQRGVVGDLAGALRELPRRGLLGGRGRWEETGGWGRAEVVEKGRAA